jgi:hypothetical protein
MGDFLTRVLEVFCTNFEKHRNTLNGLKLNPFKSRINYFNLMTLFGEV